MKKFGYTLAELMVAMTVIGVIAAVAAPVLLNIIPDKNKVKVLKYYAMLDDTINQIFEDESVYHPRTIAPNYNDGYITSINGTDPCSGLTCLEEPFEDLLQTRLIDGVRDGSTWNITDNENGTFIINVVVDGRERKQYSVGDTRNINSFNFRIEQSGNILAGDPLTDAYLSNPSKLNDKRNDLDTAARFLGERTYN